MTAEIIDFLTRQRISPKRAIEAIEKVEALNRALHEARSAGFDVDKAVILLPNQDNTVGIVAMDGGDGAEIVAQVAEKFSKGNDCA